MKEKELIKLGFKKQVDEDYYYYTLDIGNQPYSSMNLCLITNANDDLIEGEWLVSIFDYDFIEFEDYDELKKLIDILYENTKRDTQ